MASGWAKVTAEDLGERIQAFAIAMAELVGVDEVKRGGVLGNVVISKKILRTRKIHLGDA